MKSAKRRIVTLDVVRGLSIVGMIFVNNAGAPVWPQLQHSVWDGFTGADLVFPVFLVVIGLTMAQGQPPGVARVARRVVILVVLGLVVNRAGFSGPLRLPGVLQRIAVAYGLGALAYRLPRRAQLAILGALLVGWAVLLHVFGSSPGHNLDATVNTNLFGQAHLYRQLRDDPEGLVGTLSAVGSVLIGLLVGPWLREPRTYRVSLRLLIWAVGLAGAGILASWDVSINKRLWSPSYVLFTAGLTLIIVSLVYALTELRDRPPWWAWPMRVIGANAILVYLGSEFGDAALFHLSVHQSCPSVPCPSIPAHVWLFQHALAGWAGVRPGSLLFSLGFLMVLTLVAAGCWWRGWFLRV